MDRPRTDAALAVLDDHSQSNRQVIAECIRQELDEAKKADASTDEAQRQVQDMLAKEFVNARFVEPFRIVDFKFDRWSVVVQYPVGEPFMVDQDS